MIRKEQDAPANTTLGWLTVAPAGVAMAMTMLAGHAGAESVWGTLNPEGATGKSGPTQACAATMDTPASFSAAGIATFTMAEVSTHNTAASCYAVIADTVYNLTEWISQHLGEAGATDGLCGTDATAAFNGAHSGNEKAEKAFEQLTIGTLTK